MRPEFVVCIPEAITAIIGILAVIIGSLVLFKDLYWQYHIEETSYFQPLLNLIEENSGEHELERLLRDIFYQVVVIVFTAPTVFHLIIHIILTLKYKYDDEDEESGLETPEEDPDYLFGASPELVFPSPNKLHSYEAIKLESNEALKLIKDAQTGTKATAMLAKKRKPRFRVQSITEKMSRANMARLAAIANAQIVSTQQMERAMAKSRAAEDNRKESTALPRRKSTGTSTTDEEVATVTSRKTDGPRVRISEIEDTPVQVIPAAKASTTENKTNLGVLSWFTSNPSVIQERPIAQPLTTTVDKTLETPQEDALQKNAENFYMDEQQFLDPRMCKLLLLASIIFESLVAFAASYYQFGDAYSYQTYYSHENISSKVGSRSNDLKIAIHMLLSCADPEWEMRLKLLPNGDRLTEQRNSIYVCQDFRGKAWTATMCMLLGISGLVTTGVIYWQFGEILAFRDGGNYQDYQRWRMRQLKNKRRKAFASEFEPSWSTSPSVSLDSVDIQQRYQRNRLDSGEERMFSQYTVD